MCAAVSSGGGQSCSPDRADDSLQDSVKPMKERYIIKHFQYLEDVGYVGMLSDWIRGHGEAATSISCSSSWAKVEERFPVFFLSLRWLGFVMDSWRRCSTSNGDTTRASESDECGLDFRNFLTICGLRGVASLGTRSFGIVE